jgi:hypothetical protein
MKIRRTMLALAVAAAVPLAASADDRGKSSDPTSSQASMSRSFGSLDANGDGRISRAEASADDSLGGVFSNTDANGDDYLDASEYAVRKHSSIPSSQSPESASPNSEGGSSKTDPNQQQSTQPSTARPRS